MDVYLVDNPPRISQYRSPRRAKPSGVCVVHSAESFPDEVGPDTGAENVAAFIRDRTNHGSYHDLADSDSTIQLVRYSDEAFHDGTGSNPHSYGVSAATQAAKWPQLGDDWVEATVTNMARCAARYARWVKTSHGITIPARRITRAESEVRKPGFLSHALRDPARRTDPGRHFPWDLFLDNYAALMAGDPLEDDMPLTSTEIDRIAQAVHHREWPDFVTGKKSTFVTQVFRARKDAHAAAVDAAVARRLAEKQATEGRSLTEDEVEAISQGVAEDLAEGIDIEVTVGARES